LRLAGSIAITQPNKTPDAQCDQPRARSKLITADRPWDGPLRVIVGTFGTVGDIHPFIALAGALQARGHEVCFLAPSRYGAMARSRSLEFSPIGDEDAFQELFAQKEIWTHMLGYPRLAEGVASITEPSFRAVLQHHRPGRTVLALSWMFLGGRIAGEHLNLPTAMVHINPMILRSLSAPPLTPPLPVSNRLPRWWNGLCYRGMDVLLDWWFAKPFNETRAAHGLPPVRRILRDWIHAADRVIGLFPAWFAPPASDWPTQAVLTGFPLYDDADLRGFDPNLLAFLQAGEPPIVLTAGSEMHNRQAYFRAGIEACRRVNRRVLILSRFRGELPAPLPHSMHVSSYAPHSRLLPHCAAIIHHGGIGTTAQALRAGIPQLIVPSAFDQADNGARVERLGAGLTLTRFNARRGSAALRQLIQDPCRAACEALRRRFDTGDPVTEAAVWVERTFAESRDCERTAASRMG
jgi:rhamnosyltransferase subunit B